MESFMGGPSCELKNTICVHTHASMHARRHTHTSTQAHTHKHARKHARTHTHTHTCTLTHMHTDTCTRAGVPHEVRSKSLADLRPQVRKGT